MRFENLINGRIFEQELLEFSYKGKGFIFEYCEICTFENLINGRIFEQELLKFL